MQFQKFVKALTIMSFVLLSWVAHRSLRVRNECVSSSLVASVKVGSQAVPNCRHFSRLYLNNTTQLPTEDVARLNEGLAEFEPLARLLSLDPPAGSGSWPQLSLALTRTDLVQPLVWQRRLLEKIVDQRFGRLLVADFQRSLLTDFLALTVFSGRLWAHAPVKDLRFSTASVRQGLGPVLALGLARVVALAPLHEQAKVLAKLQSRTSLPLILEPLDTSLPALVKWFEKGLKAMAEVLGVTDDWAQKVVLKTLEVSSPSHWEVTVDLLQTPAWREIVAQLQARSRYRPRERVLLFTPEGALALPSGLPVDWTPAEVATQKHVMVACRWPAGAAAKSIRARHFYAEESCGKLSRAFWD